MLPDIFLEQLGDAEQAAPGRTMVQTYRKTAKGMAEIETRAHRLPPRLRSALILVDGKRSDAELSKMVLQDPDATLKALLDGGFIEARNDKTMVSAAAAAEQAVPASSPSAGQSSAQAAVPTIPAPSFEQTRREAVRALTDLVGPMAEAVALRMEKARSVEEFRPLLVLAVRVVANTRGRQMGADYGRRFGVEPEA